MKRFVFVFLCMTQISLMTACADSKTDDQASVSETALTEPAGKSNSAANPLREQFAEYFSERLPADIMERCLQNFEELVSDIEELSEDADLLTLVDKKHFLSADSAPDDLVELKAGELFTVSRAGMKASNRAVRVLRDMAKAARADGVTLQVSSAYRSYEHQKRLFTQYVNQYGLQSAERFSARAGTSQHQLGTVFDFGSVSDDFANTKSGKWLRAHACEWGFSLSFPKGYEEVTGYKWECWHYRYIGKKACDGQRKWTNDIQQYWLEIIDWYGSHK